MEKVVFLHYKFLYWDHSLPTDFMTPEGICHVACTRFHMPSHSLLRPCYPTFPTHNQQNSNLPVIPPPPLHSEMTPEKNILQVVPPPRTYSKFPLSSTHIATPLPIHINGPSISSRIFVSNRVSLCLTLGTDHQYTSFHEQNNTTIICVIGN
jgi:hypothetical protein